MAPINIGSLKDQPPCRHCGAFLWPSETSNVCCKNGALFDKTRPLESPMKVMDDPPPEIIELVTKPSLSRYISHYNHSLAMASIGGEFPETNATIRLQGKMYHSLGSLAPPPPGQRPKFASIYFYDTDHEVEHRQAHMSRTPLQPGILATLQSLLKEVNPYVRSFKAALEVYGPREDVKFVILSTAEKKEKQRDVHPGCLSLPQGSEVVHFKGKEKISLHLGPGGCSLAWRGLPGGRHCAALQRGRSQADRSDPPLLRCALLPTAQSLRSRRLDTWFAGLQGEGDLSSPVLWLPCPGWQHVQAFLMKN